MGIAEKAGILDIAGKAASTHVLLQPTVSHTPTTVAADLLLEVLLHAEHSAVPQTASRLPVSATHPVSPGPPIPTPWLALRSQRRARRA